MPNKYWKITIYEFVLIYAHYNCPIVAESIMKHYPMCSFAGGVFLFNLQLFDCRVITQFLVY